MFEQDYLMRQLLMFFRAIARSREVLDERQDPQAAADLLEDAIGNAVELDANALLALSSDSIAAVMRVTGVDPDVTQFVAHSMLLESVYLAQAGDFDLSALRDAQARAIAAEYGFDLPEDPSDFDAIQEGLERIALACGADASFGEEASFDELQALQRGMFGTTSE